MHHLHTLKTLTNSGLELLLFSAAWCRPCQATKPAVEKISQQHPVTSYVVDGEEHPEIMRQFHVKAFPTLVLLKNGQVVDSATGGKTVRQIEELIQPHL